uniref:RRM domain-containing protein n=1 Tax=Piliocolobus tephrosceles TaxID=591936 RepID=A0A8C9GV26_9PRIM
SRLTRIYIYIYIYVCLYVCTSPYTYSYLLLCLGNLDKGLTEDDIAIIFSQYGEPVDINLVRDKETGQSKGFCFLAYEDQRSTILAVDNFNGFKLLNRPLLVDHVLNYKCPKKCVKEDVMLLLTYIFIIIIYFYLFIFIYLFLFIYFYLFFFFLAIFKLTFFIYFV